jgi:hypothetical protein
MYMSEVPISGELAGRAMDEHNIASRIEFRKALGWTATGVVCVVGGIMVGGVVGDAAGLVGVVGSYWQSGRHLDMCRQERDQAQSLSELLALEKIGSLAVSAEQSATEQILVN